MPPAPDPHFDFPDPSRSFAVVGLGGAGGEAVRDLVEFGIPSVRAFAVNTDFRHLRGLTLDERILLGERTLQGRGAGGNRQAVLAAADEGREELLRRLRPFEVVFLIAGLGGGTGSALLPYLAALLRETDALPVPIVFLPFHLEIQTDSDRRENVRATLAELEEVGGLLLALSNEKLRRFDRLPIARVFHVRNAYVHHLVTSLVDMVEQPSQINVDLASLKTHLGDAGVSTLVSSEFHVSEPERLVDQALTENLLDFRLGDAPTALVHIDGGSNLTLHTMDRIIQAMRQRLGEPRRLMLGTRTHPERRDIVRLTAVVGGLRPGTLRDASGV
jgi:cell division protein FtsZ